MNEEEKERLIKKDIAMIENKVRHAFNQGYEMGVKKSRSEKPNTCGDAISRQAAIDAITKTSGIRADALKALCDVPPVTPQQRTGRWIKDEHENGVPYIWVCSNCGTYHRAMYNYCPSCGANMEAEDI